MSAINHEVVMTLVDKGVTTISYTKEDLGVEYRFSSEQEVMDLFNQLDVKGKTITFSPPNTAEDIYTLAYAVYRYTLADRTVFITKFNLSE